MAKNSLLTIILCLIISCNSSNNSPQETPWGTIVGGEDAQQFNDTTHKNGNQLNDILAQGELILATVSSPNTYYNYRGVALGTQYLLCLDFAKHIGVALRVEVCQQESELFTLLSHGEADIIITESDICKISNPDVHSVDTAAINIPHWYVNSDNKQLTDSINSWYNPEKLVAASSKGTTLMRQSTTIERRIYAPILDKSKGTISAYDHLFRKYAASANVDWRLMAAQCYQESCFDPQARSWAGACGLMQIMPSTAQTLSLPKEKIYHPEENIAAAARLLARLDNQLSDIRDYQERLCFRLAAYNCGIGHVRDAMALTHKHRRNPHRWSEVSKYMMMLQTADGYRDPVVKHGYMRASETVDYVERIRQRYSQYSGLSFGSSSGDFSSPSSGRIPSPATKKHKYKL